MKTAQKAKPRRKIPDFKSDEEAARFWDTHSAADYWDDLVEAKDVYFKRPRKQVVAVRLEPPLLRRVKALALEKGLSFSTLIRMWIVERCRKAK